MLGCPRPEILSSTQSALTRPAGGQEGVERGRATTGIYSPTTSKFLGMAYVPAAHTAVGTEIGVEIRGRVKSAAIVRRPFYVRAYRR